MNDFARLRDQLVANVRTRDWAGAFWTVLLIVGLAAMVAFLALTILVAAWAVVEYLIRPVLGG